MKPARPLTVIDVQQLGDRFDVDWVNVPLTCTNDHVVRLSVLDRDFHWHAHDNSDETFFVVRGRLLVDLEDRTIALQPGQMVTIPRGVLHRTRADGRTINLTFEHRATRVCGNPPDAPSRS